MKLKVLVLLCITCLSLGAFAQSPKVSTPLEFNNAMADIMATLSQKGNEWNEKFAQLDTTTKKFAELAPLRLSLEKYIDWKIADLKTMKDIKGSARFRQAMIAFLTFEKNLIHKSFLSVEKLKTTATDDEILKALDYFVTESSKENVEINKVKAAQQEYADRNNFSIDNP